MNVDKHIAHDPTLEPRNIRFFYARPKRAKKSPVFSPGETDILKTAGWERRGNHPTKRTDVWAHPLHSPRATSAVEQVEVKNDDGTRSFVEQTVIRNRWRHFTREEALTIEGHHRTDRVPRF